MDAALPQQNISSLHATSTPAPPPKSIHALRWAPAKVVFWLLVHLGGVLSLWYWGLDLAGLLCLFLTGPIIMCLGVSVGMHRGVIHQTYKTSALVEGILVYLATLSGVAGPISLARMHLYRDIFQQQEDCPDFFGYDISMGRSYVLSMFQRYDGPLLDETPLAPLKSSAWYRFLESTFLLQQIPLGLLLYAFAGWTGVVGGIFLRLMITYTLVWLTNYVCHTYGERPFAFPGRAEEGRNHTLFAWLSFGEGWHNNHHAFPSSAKFGLLRWQIDPAYWCIALFARLGLFWDVHLPTTQEIDTWEPPPVEKPHFSEKI
ncbi:MAG: acyl-CoA desaturase [Myxococcales bacterium]|nr:acyl-CoA desaturase [Myxococcales bacterium]